MSISKSLLSRALPACAILAAAGVAGLFGLHTMRSSAERDVYRDRLQGLTTEYESLRSMYNTAVKQTAVTELVVKDRTLTVVVRNALGDEERVPTPYDPSGEIYVDYAVIDGRVWIRRVFDMLTPPANATVLDPRLVSIDWDAEGAQVGKAVYRSLDEGRWVISVSGSGALGLRRTSDQEIVTLSPAPLISDFGTVEREAEQAADGIGLLELLTRAVGG